MNLIEITCPAGAIDGGQRRTIAAAIIDNLLTAPDAPVTALTRAGRATHVWFRGGETWTTGGDPRPDEPGCPLVATITVPEAWREEIASHVIGAVRTALAEHAPQVGLETESAVWINVVGVQDGGIGMNGRASGGSDIVRHLTRDIEIPVGDDLPDDVRIDPVCGMRVRLGAGAVTLVHDGHAIAFCATGCRDVYAEDHGIGSP